MNLFTNDERLETMSPQSLELIGRMTASVRYLADELRAYGLADVQVAGLIVGVALAASWPYG
jgi:hypothetical protein